MKFVPRLTKPEAGNPYYNTKSNGGYNPCIVGNPTDKGCNVLANCVGYEVARFNEEINAGKCKYLGSMNAYNMYDWAKRHGLPVGQTPKLGACICFSGGSNGLGHLGNIEELDKKNGNCSTSSSGYKSYTFKVQKNCNKSNNYGMSLKYKLQGFIYNPELEDNDPIEEALCYIEKAESILRSIK